MAVREVKDIQVYTGSQWSSLKNQQVFTDDGWKTLGIGSGISDGNDWYVLEAPKGTLISNDITLFGKRNFGTAIWEFTANSVFPVNSEVKVNFRVSYENTVSFDTVTIKIPAKSSTGTEKVTLKKQGITWLKLNYITVTPNKDEKQTYSVTNVPGTIFA